MRRRSRPTAPPDGPLAPALRRRFPDGLAAPEPEKPPPPPPTWTEAEVMAAAFAALADGAELDLRGVRIVTARPSRPPAKAPSVAPRATSVPGDRSRKPDSSQLAPVPGDRSGKPDAARVAAPVPGDRSAKRPGAPDPRPGQPVLEDRSAERPGAPDPRVGERAAVEDRPAERPRGPSPVPEDRCAAPPDPRGSLRAAAAVLRGRPWQGPGWRDSPEHGAGPTDAAERDVLARARHHSVPTLTIRGERREPAIAAVAAFVRLHRAAGRRYVRVVTGKGLGSAGDPVLKLALDEWCRGEGEPEVSAWAPERDRDGDYGAVVLRLRPRSP